MYTSKVLIWGMNPPPTPYRDTKQDHRRQGFCLMVVVVVFLLMLHFDHINHMKLDQVICTRDLDRYSEGVSPHIKNLSIHYLDRWNGNWINSIYEQLSGDGLERNIEKEKGFRDKQLDCCRFFITFLKNTNR